MTYRGLFYTGGFVCPRKRKGLDVCMRLQDRGAKLGGEDGQSGPGSGVGRLGDGSCEVDN